MLSRAGDLEGSPDTSVPVASHHGRPDGELQDTEQTLEDDIPSWAIGSQHTDELQAGHRHPKHPGEKGDQNQSEGPAPAAQHADGQQPNEHSQRGQEGNRHPSRRAGWEAQCLVKDLWGRCQDDDQADQRHEEEAQDQRLSPVDHQPTSEANSHQELPAPVSTPSHRQGQIGSSATSTETYLPPATPSLYHLP
jgi:hypothetical protein